MLDLQTINFDKLGGLIPVCVQDYQTMQLLMVGFMNSDALQQTLATQRVTFFSRERKKLWVKGETSGHYLLVKDYCFDCDNDSLLIYAKACGPTCHTGNMSCFKANKQLPLYWLGKLMTVIADRHQNPQKNSYTTALFDSGIKRIAQKVGEEGVEVALAAVAGDQSELANEVTDLLFHLFVLLQKKNLVFASIADVIAERMEE